ncbi:MAG: NAD-dependent succinate-semialdehyde dehydrogenase [Solirubrobacterales bacterium]|nr:NAD-dependent succinate-semialdehyde dehydrogenase [Solirubrobacterales bacterium]
MEIKLEDLSSDSLKIGGEWVPSGDGSTFSVEDPGSNETLATVADATPADAVAALDAACAVSGSWAATAPRERGEILRRAFELVIENRDELARLLTLEMGRPVAESQLEINYGAEFLRWFSEEAVRSNGRFGTAPAGGADILTSREPVGPCLLITPWNFPLAMATRKIAPAIAAGCTIVIKPARETPLTTMAFLRILERAGLPEGVLNLVTTTDPRGVIMPLFEDERLRKVSFTGSTPVGKALVEAASKNLLRTSMELGGNAPLIVFDDADIEQAVQGAALAKMRNAGQSCVAANRIFVDASVVDEFTEGLAAAIDSMKVAHGLEPESQVGPLIGQSAVDEMGALVGDAVAKGAQSVGGEIELPDRGFFFTPTVLAEVDDSMTLAQEEIFGPIAAIQSFSDEDEVIARANRTSSGLASYIFTKDLDRARRAAKALEVGMVGINRGLISDASAPFGGIKTSGFGREGGHEGMAEYESIKYVSINH